jgi:hypothetical protein
MAVENFIGRSNSVNQSIFFNETGDIGDRKSSQGNDKTLKLPYLKQNRAKQFAKSKEQFVRKSVQHNDISKAMTLGKFNDPST